MNTIFPDHLVDGEGKPVPFSAKPAYWNAELYHSWHVTKVQLTAETLKQLYDGEVIVVEIQSERYGIGYHIVLQLAKSVKSNGVMPKPSKSAELTQRLRVVREQLIGLAGHDSRYRILMSQELEAIAKEIEELC